MALFFFAAAAQGQQQTFTCPGGFGPVIAPFIPMSSLKTVANPVLPKDPVTGQPTLRADLADYVASLPTAIQLGKALFWDVQAGSDTKTACATCHFQAGADVRSRNQLNPGANGVFDLAPPNSLYAATSFPISPLYDDVSGSQGIRKCQFGGFSKSGAELTTSLADPLFSVGGKNVRQVTGKNTPSTHNAVFNHRNFWNGRAQPQFNGVNPFGNRDTSARVWVLGLNGSLATIDIHIPNASLASQAVGPPLNTTEMSASGRTFPDVGHKLLLAKPLGLQKVDAGDSVLGGIADTLAGKGLTVSYQSLVQQAFQPKWWNSTKRIKIGSTYYTMTEANFSLFWGLSIMLYEATLVSDNTPVDQYLDSGRTSTAALDALAARLQPDLPGVTSSDILNGLALFEQPLPPLGIGVGCIGCHVGAETTSASVANLAGPGLEAGDIAFKNAGFDLRLERMFMNFPPVPAGANYVTFDPATYTVMPYTAQLDANGNVVLDANGNPIILAAFPQAPVAVYDAGWYNVGVRPTADDPGLDGTDPFGNSLSWTRLFQAAIDPSFIKVPGGGLGCAGAGNAQFPGEVLNATGFPLLSGSLLKTEATDVGGSFKTAALRNVELNGPYFHNGGKATLRQVLEFYDGGGEFANPTLAPIIKHMGFLSQNGQGMTPTQANNLVAFLVALTDERVRLQKAPFDHPQLFVPNGQNPDGTDAMVEVPAVGAGGSSTPVTRFLGLNPFTP